MTEQEAVEAVIAWVAEVIPAVADNTVRIPLHARDGSVRGYALLDGCDAGLAQHRWYLHPRGYVRRSWRDGARVRTATMGRVVAGLLPDDPREVDHFNGDKLDNRRENLRVLSHPHNGQNLPARGRGSSRHRGVSFHAPNGRWRAYARVDGRLHHLGYHDDEDVAASVAAAFRQSHMPFSNESRT